MALLSAVAGPFIYLDTNVFIYALEAFPEYVEVTTELFAALDRGQFQAVTSELTLAEALVKPIMDNDPALKSIYDQALQTSKFLHVVPVNRRVLTLAAEIRASTGLRLPDAIHAATSKLASCETFLTNDTQFRSVIGLPVVVLSEAM
jgi:predicted nucleic acid-binding protein